MKYYQQKFSFELHRIIRLVCEIEIEKNFNEMIKKYSKDEMATELGIGRPKYDTIIQYMEFSGLIEKNNETIFNEKIRKMKFNLDYIEPLIYYNLVKSPLKGGHYILSNLVNEVLYKNYLENYDTEINQKVLVEEAIKLIGHEQIKETDWKRMVKMFLGDLADPETGFGKLGILEKLFNTKETSYEIHSYWVEPLVAAYIIYDMWEENQTTMELEKIINEKYNIGRMFLMDEDSVMETLEEMQVLKLITIETIAGLNQIRINKQYDKYKILDMIIGEA